MTIRRCLSAKACIASLAHLQIVRSYVAHDFEVLILSLNKPAESANAGLKSTPYAELRAHDKLPSLGSCSAEARDPTLPLLMFESMVLPITSRKAVWEAQMMALL